MMVGRLAADPEVHTSDSGDNIASFPLTSKTDRTADPGDPETVTSDLHRVVARGKLAELVRHKLTAGMDVYVEGRLVNRCFDHRDHSRRLVTEVRLDVLNVLTWNAAGALDEVTLNDETSEPKAS